MLRTAFRRSVEDSWRSRLPRRASKAAFASLALAVAVATALAFAPVFSGPSVASAEDAGDEKKHFAGFDRQIVSNLDRSFLHGRRIFRDDTFGDEAFWGDALQLHQAVQGERFGGVGGGLTPRSALALGLKVDVSALPRSLQQDLRRGRVNLDDPAITLALLKLDAVVGVKGFFAGDRLRSIGITCALCHSTVDDALAPGIGNRLDGWAARDLDVGSIIALAPDLSPFSTLLGVGQDDVRKVLRGWGPGKFDAELILDG